MCETVNQQLVRINTRYTYFIRHNGEYFSASDSLLSPAFRKYEAMGNHDCHGIKVVRQNDGSTVTFNGADGKDVVIWQENSGRIAVLINDRW